MIFNIKEKVVGVLKQVNVPFAFAQKRESTLPFILFNISEEKGKYFGDDEELAIQFEITINIFSRGDYEAIKNSITKKMLAEGFNRTNIPACQFIEEASVYNQPMYFNYIYYKENDICQE